MGVVITSENTTDVDQRILGSCAHSSNGASLVLTESNSQDSESV